MNVFLLIIYVFLLYLYLPLNRRPSRYYFYSKIDPLLPLIPSTVWIYCSYYFLHPLAIIGLWLHPLYLPLMLTLIISTALSSLVWWLLPNGVKRPSFHPNHTLSQKLLAYIYSHDNDSNGFPSGHISHTLICSFFLSLAYPQSFWIFVFWSIAISISTLTTKQHYLFDYIFTVPTTFLLISTIQFLL